MLNTTIYTDNGFNELVQIDIEYTDSDEYQLFIKDVNVTYLIDDETRKEVVAQIELVL